MVPGAATIRRQLCSIRDVRPDAVFLVVVAAVSTKYRGCATVSGHTVAAAGDDDSACMDFDGGDDGALLCSCLPIHFLRGFVCVALPATTSAFRRIFMRARAFVAQSGGTVFMRQSHGWCSLLCVCAGRRRCRNIVWYQRRQANDCWQRVPNGNKPLPLSPALSPSVRSGPSLVG